ncbi:MAG TPA: murein biosynthesis integral membrane protein MurJ [Verrucomicrobiae bacterium]
MLKSSGGIGAATMASRVLGLVRDQSLAAFMGTHGVASAFSYAFMVPNLFRRLLGEGALTAAFIPIFKAKEKNEGEASMWQAANAVISGLMVVAPVLVFLAMLVLSLLLVFGNWDQDTRLMFQLMRLMFPYMIFACAGAVFMGILNARGHFFIPALSPAILNIVLIASVWLVAPHFGAEVRTRVFGLAWGVLAAGVAQAYFQLPSMRSEGFRYRWTSPWLDPATREVVRKMVPSAVGVAAFQLNVLLTQTLAFGENKDIVAEFFYAVRLMELPQGVFGLSLATFLLPTLSALAVEKNYHQFRAHLRLGVSHLIFVNLLSAVLLFTLAEPIIRLLFERGKFDAASTSHVSFGLVCLAPGLISFSLVNILARAFYALNDITTPMRISVFCLTVNLLLTAFFLFGAKLGAGALGVANSLSSFCNLALLLFALRKKLKTLEMRECLVQLPQMAAAGLAAGLTAWGIRWIWERNLGHATLPHKLCEVFLPMIAATAVYFGISWRTGISSAREIISLLLSRAKRAG